ncbi:MAG: ABC transporter ATP-binding protein, partial [Candidatus Kerfeldbacteria bacterium CG_4_10_14_0_8_um_filter_42_10]
LLKDLVKRKQKTIVMVTHNEDLTRFCDRVIKVVDGRLA